MFLELKNTTFQSMKFGLFKIFRYTPTLKERARAITLKKKQRTDTKKDAKRIKSDNKEH